MVVEPVPLVRLTAHITSIFVLVLVGGLALAATAPALLGYGSVVVVSGSMEPTIKVADVVLTTPTDGEGLGPGAVINFEHEDEAMRLHRIVGVTEEGYRTAGDANRQSDTDVVSPAQVEGVGAVVVPFIGWPTMWIARGQWPLLVISFLVLAAAAYMSRARWVSLESDFRL